MNANLREVPGGLSFYFHTKKQITLTKKQITRLNFFGAYAIITVK